MEETGYVSSVASPEVLEAMSDSELEETIDASYFFGEIGKEAKLDPILYPDKEVVERCAMMHDSGDRTSKLLDMWSRIKSNDVPAWNYTIIVLSFVALLILAIRRKIQKSHKASHRAPIKKKQR